MILVNIFLILNLSDSKIYLFALTINVKKQTYLRINNKQISYSK